MPLLRARILAPLFLATALLVSAAPRVVSLRWENNAPEASIRVDRGSLVSLVREPGRIDLTIDAAPNPEGLPTLVSVGSAPRGFTFRLADVDAEYPIFLPDDRVIVTAAADRRAYSEIVAAIRARGGSTQLQRIAAAPEASFAAAATAGRDVKLQTWLGVGRDVRLFRVDEALESFQPRFAGYDVPLPDLRGQPATYAFQFGRGRSVRDNVVRSLDEGALPILRATIDDDAIQYDVVAFASLERAPLAAGNVRGTDCLVADVFGHGHMFTPAQAAAEKQKHDAELASDDDVVLCVRAVATNRSRAPAYAFLRTATPMPATPISPKPPAWTFEPTAGLSLFAPDRVFAASRLNGAPSPAEENSVLLRPGASAVFEFIVPHRPLSRVRALALATRPFEARLAEAQAYWRAKLDSAAQLRLPEPRLDAMLRAGLLHLDLVAYGREPHEPLLPAIGVYTAIGSESAPIIQYWDSVGWHEQAARALDFFLAKQHDDGFMQNFNGYMLETGAVLWTLGEHYRYTRDDAWVRRVHANLTKACAYLQAWRQRNQRGGAPDDGNFGLLDGKTADPDDPYRSFMLNGYAYLGLARAAEMLRALAPDESARWRAEADALKSDLRRALASALEQGPVVPLGNGTWSRAAAPWTNYHGPVMLHADGGRWFTHGAITSRDSLLGPLYLAFQEVIAPDETMASELLATHAELMTRDNVAFTQPYYSRHPWLHLQRGETKAFLQAWYGTVAAMADRETFTFNEHLFPVSAHKTHEEAWFLMETRWMLYREDGDTLRLLGGVPRAYFAPGATLGVKNAGSYFGALSFEIKVSSDGHSARATIDCPGPRRPAAVEIRLPGKDAVRVAPFSGHAELNLTIK